MESVLALPPHQGHHNGRNRRHLLHPVSAKVWMTEMIMLPFLSNLAKIASLGIIVMAGLFHLLRFLNMG
jgi:hypothetical protein